MNDVFIEALKQVPALAVVVFLVIWFLRFLEKSKEHEAKRIEEVHQAYKREVTQIKSRYETYLNDITNNNTKVLAENTDMYRRVIEAVTKLES